MSTEVMQFRLQPGCGFHHEPVPDYVGDPLNPDRVKKYIPGEVVHSTRELDKVFVNKFRRLTQEEVAPPIDMDKRKKEVDVMITGGPWTEDDRKFLETVSDENLARLQNRFINASSKAGDTKVASILGEDVTSQFQRAYDEGFKVFRNSKDKFQITTSANVKKPLNKEALDEDGVDKFVDQYLKEK